MELNANDSLPIARKSRPPSPSTGLGTSSVSEVSVATPRKDDCEFPHEETVSASKKDMDELAKLKEDKKKQLARNAVNSKNYRARVKVKGDEKDEKIAELMEGVATLKAQQSSFIILQNAVMEYYKVYGLVGLVSTAAYVKKLADKKKKEGNQ